MSESGKVSSGYGTHVGCVRDHNEDSFTVVPDLGLWLVADGMGGYESGEVASAIVVEYVTDDLRRGVGLAEAMTNAHQAVLDAPQQGRGQSGMGATAVALKLEGTSYRIAWVGDSRAYLWGGKHLQQLTRDHSFVQRLLDGGSITWEEAEAHPRRNIVTQAIGSLEIAEVKVDSVSGELYRGERLLLCSDGLTSEVPDAEIEPVFAQGLDDLETVEQLIDLALRHGGEDNVTVVIVSAPADACPRPRVADTVRMDTTVLNRLLVRKKRGRIAAVLGLIVVLLAIGLGIARYLGWKKTSSSLIAGGTDKAFSRLPVLMRNTLGKVTPASSGAKSPQSGKVPSSEGTAKARSPGAGGSGAH